MCRLKLKTVLDRYFQKTKYFQSWYLTQWKYYLLFKSNLLCKNTVNIIPIGESLKFPAPLFLDIRQNNNNWFHKNLVYNIFCRFYTTCFFIHLKIISLNIIFCSINSFFFNFRRIKNDLGFIMLVYVIDNYDFISIIG